MRRRETWFYFEITLVGYTHDGAHLNRYLASDGSEAEVEDPLLGVFRMGFCLAIGGFRGLVGSESDPQMGPGPRRRRQHPVLDTGRG